MNLVRRIVGFLLLLFIWYDRYNTIVGVEVVDLDSIIVFNFIQIFLLFGLSYALLHNKHYPVRAIISLLIAEFVVYKWLPGDGYYFETTGKIYFLNPYTLVLYLGTILVLAGEWGAKFFCWVLSPVQKFLKSIGIKATIPVMVGVLFVPFSLWGFAFLGWLEKYQELQGTIAF